MAAEKTSSSDSLYPKLGNASVGKCGRMHYKLAYNQTAFLRMWSFSIQIEGVENHE